jgi:hypothetical protein
MEKRMTTYSEEQKLRRDTLDNDISVRQQQKQSVPPATFHSFAQAEADTPRGRFTATEKATVIGVSPPSYPELPSNSPFHHDVVGPEPPLGFSVEEMQPVGSYHEIQVSLERLGEPASPSGQPDGGSAAAPSNSSSFGVMRAGPPSFSKKRS